MTGRLSDGAERLPPGSPRPEQEARPGRAHLRPPEAGRGAATPRTLSAKPGRSAQGPTAQRAAAHCERGSPPLEELLLFSSEGRRRNVLGPGSKRHPRSML